MNTAKFASQEDIRLLRQLQEYEITLNEARIMHGETEALEAVEECIRAIREKLERDVLARYDRLSKAGPGLVTVKDGMCMGCYIMIPRGDLNRISAGKADPACPNCGIYIAT
jgi:predicted  nucleic acid-binding Zn-ribbon protein